MNWKLPDTHSAISALGALALTGFIFLHPQGLTIEDIGLAFLTINGGQTVGALGKGGQRLMQGGSTAPDQIIPPGPAPEVTRVPFVKP